MPANPQRRVATRSGSPIESARVHQTLPQLEAGLAHVLQSPTDQGCLLAIYARPKANERVQLQTANLSPEGGLEQDRWASDHWQKLPDGRPDPRSQVSLMNARVLQLVAGDSEAMCLAGDNLIVDFDLSEQNLPAGSRVRIGPDVVLELTDQPHTGCAKFARRYGPAARAFVNWDGIKQLHLRGRYAQVITTGTIRAGDPCLKT